MVIDHETRVPTSPAPPSQRANVQALLIEVGVVYKASKFNALETKPV